MAHSIFTADVSMPGLAGEDFLRRAADSSYTGSVPTVQDSRLRRALRGLDRHLLRDIGLDGGAS